MTTVIILFTLKQKKNVTPSVNANTAATHTQSLYTLRSQYARCAFIILWIVNKCLIDMTAFLIKNSMCYQQGLVRGTKDSDTLLKVPKSWPYGQRKSKAQDAWSRTVCLWTQESSLHLDLFHLPSGSVQWGCLLTGIAVSARTSHWFWWTTEIVTIMCPSITLFFFPLFFSFSFPPPWVREGLFKMLTPKLSLGDGVLTGAVHAIQSCCSRHLFAISALVTFCSQCQIFSEL